jgi:hypothetical protein
MASMKEDRGLRSFSTVPMLANAVVRFVTRRRSELHDCADHAANEFGLRAEKWQFLTRFSNRPDLALAEFVRAEYNAYANPLEWVRDRIAGTYEAAHVGILEMYPMGPSDRLVLLGLRGPAGDDCGEQGDHNENDCATDSDDVEIGYGPREGDRYQHRDAREYVHRRQAQRGAVARYPCMITAHRRWSADADELIAPEAPLRGRPINRDEQCGQEDKGDGDRTRQDDALSFH